MAETLTKPNTNSPDASGDRDKSRGRSSPAQEDLQGLEKVFIPYEGFLGTSAVKEQLRRSLAEPVQTALEEPAGETSFLDALLGTSMLEPPIERHAEIMSDPRFSHPANAPTSSRIVNRLHQTYGNGHVQRVTDYIQAMTDKLSPDSLVQLAAGRVQPKRDTPADHLKTKARTTSPSVVSRGSEHGLSSYHTDRAQSHQLDVAQHMTVSHAHGPTRNVLQRALKYIREVPESEAESKGYKRRTDEAIKSIEQTIRKATRDVDIKRLRKVYATLLGLQKQKKITYWETSGSGAPASYYPQTGEIRIHVYALVKGGRALTTMLIHEAAHALHGREYRRTFKRYGKALAAGGARGKKALELLKFHAFTEYWAYRSQYELLNLRQPAEFRTDPHEEAMKERTVKNSIRRVERETGERFDPTTWRPREKKARRPRRKQVQRSVAQPVQTKLEQPTAEASFLDALPGTSMLQPPIERHAAIISKPSAGVQRRPVGQAGSSNAIQRAPDAKGGKPEPKGPGLLRMRESEPDQAQKVKRKGESLLTPSPELCEELAKKWALTWLIMQKFPEPEEPVLNQLVNALKGKVSKWAPKGQSYLRDPARADEVASTKAVTSVLKQLAKGKPEEKEALSEKELKEAKEKLSEALTKALDSTKFFPKWKKNIEEKAKEHWPMLAIAGAGLVGGLVAQAAQTGKWGNVATLAEQLPSLVDTTIDIDEHWKLVIALKESKPIGKEGGATVIAIKPALGLQYKFDDGKTIELSGTANFRFATERAAPFRMRHETFFGLGGTW